MKIKSYAEYPKETYQLKCSQWEFIIIEWGANLEKWKWGLYAAREWESVGYDVNWEEGNLYARIMSLVLTEQKNKEENIFFIQP